MVAAHALRAAGADRCQVVAKCQQAVEKAVKGLAEAMNVLGLMTMPVGSSHQVARYAAAIVRAAREAPRAHQFLKRALPRLLPAHVQGCIAALDAVVPQYPPPGHLAMRNTEYPFQSSPTEWEAPSAAGTFSEGNVRRYLAAAARVQGGASKVISSLDFSFPENML